jgi:hypothetical protein
MSKVDGSKHTLSPRSPFLLTHYCLLLPPLFSASCDRTLSALPLHGSIPSPSHPFIVSSSHPLILSPSHPLTLSSSHPLILSSSHPPIVSSFRFLFPFCAFTSCYTFALFSAALRGSGCLPRRRGWLDLQVIVPTGSWVVHIEVRPLGGDSFKVTLDASKPSGLAG